MAKILKFAALYPKHLDLNGDHGNLLVLQKRLAWRGVSADIVSVTKPTDLEQFDFVLLGHGSRDAWAEVLRIDPELISKVGKLVRASKSVMAISSGYELLIEELESSSVTHANHVSEFRVVDKVVGYVNSDLVLPEIQQLNQTVMTLFHGPVLAKNPELADQVISKAGWCDVAIRNIEIDSVNELASTSRRIAFED